MTIRIPFDYVRKSYKIYDDLVVGSIAVVTHGKRTFEMVVPNAETSKLSVAWRIRKYIAETFRSKVRTSEIYYKLGFVNLSC
jgi:hypothetical protein